MIIPTPDNRTDAARRKSTAPAALYPAWTLQENGVNIDPKVILATLDDFDDGKSIHSPEGLIAAGYPADFINPLAETFVDDPDDWHKTLRGADGKRLEHLRGVHDLDILTALAEHVGADLSDPDLQNMGRGWRARAYVSCIRQALERRG
jgi:hypothetical protein